MDKKVKKMFETRETVGQPCNHTVIIKSYVDVFGEKAWDLLRKVRCKYCDSLVIKDEDNSHKES